MSFFKTFLQKIGGLLGIVPGHIRENAGNALHITKAIKAILDNPVADMITGIIPGTWDDNLKQLAIDALGKTIPYLQVVDSCKDAPSTAAMVECWITELRKMDKHVRNALLFKLASLLTAMLDNGERKQSEYDYYVQLLYSAGKELKQD